MAWNKSKAGKRYYTRSHRAPDGRVKREYVAGGRVGELAAMLDAITRQERRSERAQERAQLQAVNASGEALTPVDAIAELLTQAAMIAAGFHLHRRQWRRSGGSKPKSEPRSKPRSEQR